jgi:thermitase
VRHALLVILAFVLLPVAAADANSGTGPGDPLLDRQWALENTGADPDGTAASFHAGTPDADMDVMAAWSATRGAGVVVAVVDTGVDATHPDLAGQLAAGARDFVGDGIAATADPDGHGTKLAGAIAAARGNGEGIAGIAPEAAILALRALGREGVGTDAAIAAALDYAGDQQVRVVDASFNGPRRSAAIEQAIADHPDTLYVVAAGNEGADDDAVATYPCDLPLANVLCVGASTNADEPAWFSNHGSVSVDLFAPGDGIAVPTRGGGYVLSSGTSLAAANVAGEAALVLGARPGLTTRGLKDAILRSGDVLPALLGLSATARRADAAAAVQLAMAGDVPADAAEDPVPAAPAPVAAAAPIAVPADPDADGRAGAADACPAVRAATLDGCPLPAVVSFRVSVPRHSRRATATVRADRAATVALRIERRRCARSRCRWQRVAARTVASRSGRASISRRLARGRYRATAALRSRAGAARPRRRAFHVR